MKKKVWTTAPLKHLVKRNISGYKSLISSIYVYFWFWWFRTPANSPLEVGSENLPLVTTGFSTIPTVVGLGISAPSTVSQVSSRETCGLLELSCWIELRRVAFQADSAGPLEKTTYDKDYMENLWEKRHGVMVLICFRVVYIVYIYISYTSSSSTLQIRKGFRSRCITH